MYTNTNVFRFISRFPASKRNSNPSQKNPYLPKICHRWELDPSNSSPIPLLTTKKFLEAPKKKALGGFAPSQYFFWQEKFSFLNGHLPPPSKLPPATTPAKSPALESHAAAYVRLLRSPALVSHAAAYLRLLPPPPPPPRATKPKLMATTATALDHPTTS